MLRPSVVIDRGWIHLMHLPSSKGQSSRTDRVWVSSQYTYSNVELVDNLLNRSHNLLFKRGIGWLEDPQTLSFDGWVFFLNFIWHQHNALYQFRPGMTKKIPTFLNKILVNSNDFFLNVDFAEGLHSFAQYEKFINCFLLIFLKCGFYFEDLDLLNNAHDHATAILTVSNREANFTRTATSHPKSPH